MLHNTCQIAGDDYVDHDNILETITAQELGQELGKKTRKWDSYEKWCSNKKCVKTIHRQ